MSEHVRRRKPPRPKAGWRAVLANALAHDGVRIKPKPTLPVVRFLDAEPPVTNTEERA